MAFAFTIDKTIQGINGKIICGTYTSTGSGTGGDIVTGLGTVFNLTPQAYGSSVIANAPAVNETFPLSNAGGTVTIVTAADEVGCWMAIGD